MIYVYYRLIENVSPEKAVQLYQQAASVFEVSGGFLGCWFSFFPTSKELSSPRKYTKMNELVFRVSYKVKKKPKITFQIGFPSFHISG